MIYPSYDVPVGPMERQLNKLTKGEQHNLLDRPI